VSRSLWTKRARRWVVTEELQCKTKWTSVYYEIVRMRYKKHAVREKYEISGDKMRTV